MILKHDDDLVDFEHSMLEELLFVIDTQLSKIELEINDCSDPDSLGLYDSAEGIIGMGFVACQWYLTATYGYLKIQKNEALQLGPTHTCGLTIVQLVNHTANYWKHREEWSFDKNLKDATRTKEALSKLGIDCEHSYVLSCALAELNSSKGLTLKPLLHPLGEWSKEVWRASENSPAP